MDYRQWRTLLHMKYLRGVAAHDLLLSLVWQGIAQLMHVRFESYGLHMQKITAPQYPTRTDEWVVYGP